jgi:hypothetical protein
MSSLLERLKKNSTIKEASILATSKFFTDNEMIPTKIPAINIALSGSLDGGIIAGLHTLAGPSRHFKTSFALVMVKAYLDKYPDAIVVWYDSEFGSPQSYFSNYGIDLNSVWHVPIMDMEEFKFDIMNQFEQFTKEDKVIVVLDSYGNLASKKEKEDSIDQKSTTDMTRARVGKGIFRMITPYLQKKDIPMLTIAHTYQTQEIYSKAVVSGGCLEAGTEIIMSDDSTKNIEEVKVGELVKTLNGPKSVTHIWNPKTLKNGKPECYEVEFEDGYKCTVSENHPFLTTTGWVEANKLTNDIDLVFIDRLCKNKLKSISSVGTREVYDISVQDVEHYILENGVVTHNTGIMYSSNSVWIIGRSQEKDGSELVGYNFNITVDKSRFVREKSKIPITVTFEGGIDEWSGLLDIALEAGVLCKPTQGWISKVDDETGEIQQKKYRAKDTNNAEFWNPILQSMKFKKWVENRYKISNGSMLDDEIDTELESIDIDIDMED